MDILEKLQWRYATKEFDPTQKITEEKLHRLLEGLRWSASSLGLQAWKVMVVENPEVRASLVGLSYGQKQVAEASHLLVLCRVNEVDEPYAEDYIDLVSSTRQIPKEELSGYSGMVKGFINGMADEAKTGWLDHQIYLALGNLLTICAMEEVDSCPMEGFDKAAVNEVLETAAMGLTAVVMCPVGYRSSADKYASLAKVRRPLEEIVIRK
ncbi:MULTISPECIES: NAD(P)H-dependent oxidoreductase [Persicobacter]|uniref:NAD(P)H-dependent oxidoreductase n=1 Tax=Persicobacter diffluens TaxID=981 RepID=A0AAN5AJS2_9BACT|nr:NAD(P)H-dependent oxidoreductase [Persicobacter sp. CCB-QB2]GJM61960.1 NAD(P)H-dependent oxidoreductase [Persicobacter diffluens]